MTRADVLRELTRERLYWQRVIPTDFTKGVVRGLTIAVRLVKDYFGVPAERKAL